jgi:hypothetical protein
MVIRYQQHTCRKCGQRYTYDSQEDKYLFTYDNGESACEHWFGGIPDNPFRPGTQNHRIYEAMRRRPVTNAEMVRVMGIFKYTSRISSVRRYLEGFGMTVLATPMNKEGLYSYQMT